MIHEGNGDAPWRHGSKGLEEGAACTPEAAPLFQETDPASRRVLIVDDDPFVLDVVSEMIRLLGFRVTKAHSPMEALSLMSESWALVLADFDMPVLNGFSMGIRIKNQRPEIPVVIMTGHPEEQVDWYTRSERMDGWLFKPFKVEDLHRLFQNLGMRPKMQSKRASIRPNRYR